MNLIPDKDNLQFPDPMTIEYLEAMSDFEGQELHCKAILAPTKLSIANCKIAHYFLINNNIFHNLDCDASGGVFIEINHPEPNNKFHFYFSDSGINYYWLIKPAPGLEIKSYFYKFDNLEDFYNYYQNLIFI